jgi:hypothetical protein
LNIVDEHARKSTLDMYARRKYTTKQFLGIGCKEVTSKDARRGVLDPRLGTLADVSTIKRILTETALCERWVMPGLILPS